MGRLDYYRRIFSAYLTRNKSQLTFWHGEPQINENFKPEEWGEYYMPFIAKTYWRFSERLKKDKMLRKKITEIMSYVKG